MKDTRHWSEQYTWVPSDYKHVWFCVETGNYHFSDEAEQIDIQSFETADKCVTGLSNYCKTL